MSLQINIRVPDQQSFEDEQIYPVFHFQGKELEQMMEEALGRNSSLVKTWISNFLMEAQFEAGVAKKLWEEVEYKVQLEVLKKLVRQR